MSRIEEYTVTDASIHDSQAIEQLLTNKDKGLPLYADSTYTGEEQEKIYKSKNRDDSPRKIAKLLFLRGNLTYNICRCTQFKIVVNMGYLPAGRKGYVRT